MDLRPRGLSGMVAALAAAVVLAGCAGASTNATTATGSPVTSGGSADMSIILESPSFVPGSPIPVGHTADGDDTSPALSWSGIPPETRELALIVDDPDAPRAEPWVHWLVYKIPADASGLEEGSGAADGTRLPSGALQGENDFGALGYGGPAPPRGHGTHRYYFKLYALDAPLEFAPGARKPDLLAAMQGHILAQGELVGTYER